MFDRLNFNLILRFPSNFSPTFSHQLHFELGNGLFLCATGQVFVNSRDLAVLPNYRENLY